MDKELYLEKVYGGILGKCIGVRLGAPVEPTVWSYERIKKVYGEITGYVKDYKNFAADDDINGPLFFIRALLDHKPPLTAEKIGQTWLNYTREEIGFYWWGGEGISTEHTAYLNLKKGIPAPRSGSELVNGKTLAEQIGGQIFIDTWGLVFPEDPSRAAAYAAMAASVSHDGNGLHGARFVASLISMAFSADTDRTIAGMIEKALTFLPEDSEYTRVVKAVRDFHRDHQRPEQWRDALTFLHSYFGYDKYPGVCHIIPNSGVLSLALYYGDGNFARTIEIATMCGWDTDCNAGNAGTILGVLKGPEGIPDHYRKPVNDFHAASSIAGALNIIDLPTAAKEVAILGIKEAGSEVPESWNKGTFSDDIVLDFSVSGTTSGIRTSNRYLAPVIRNNGRGELSVILDRLKKGESVRIFYKPYYRRKDFDDERYSPTFTPLVYPGQTMKIKGRMEKWSGKEISVSPFVLDSTSEKLLSGPEIVFTGGGTIDISWIIPDIPFAVDEAGLLFKQGSEEKYLGELFISSFEITGKKDFIVDFKEERKEFSGLSRCSLSGGKWELRNGSLHAQTENIFLLFTGPYYCEDYCVETSIIAVKGVSHCIIFRAIGAERGYFFGFNGQNTAALIKRDHDNTILEEIEFPWKKGELYKFKVQISGSDITCIINGEVVLSYSDSDHFPYGMAGLGKLGAGETIFKNIIFHETRK